MTASAHYSRPIDNGNNWSTSLIWGRNHDTFTRHNVNSYLLETVYPVSRRNLLTGRAELVDKDELFADDPDLESRLAADSGGHFPDRRVHDGLHAGPWARFHTLQSGSEPMS
jgi:hypothetical protein